MRIPLLSLILLFGVSACAGSFSASKNQSAEEVYFSRQKIIAFSKKVEHLLADKGVRVAILGRMGRKESELPEGTHYTHVAFAVYSVIKTGEGKTLPTYVLYNLYQKADHPDQSELVQDFPVDFFAGVAQLEAGAIVPSAKLQARLLEIISSPRYQKFHDPHYSLIANPYNLGLQNCTEFVLDIITAAIYQTDDMQKIKASENTYFTAQRVNVNPFKLLLGSLFNAEVSMKDQKPMAVTATFETIAAFLQKLDQGSAVLHVKAD